MICKPDGGIRLCIDYRRLNAATVKYCYPMPLIDDILDVLGNSKLFSTMDIASGYWNVPMAEHRKDRVHYGLYEWLVMPFGLCNAVPAFERLMENVLIDLKWRTCLVYLDDCVVFSVDFPTHMVRLKQVLERFRTAGFKLKMKKCKWGRDQVTFLGHIVTPSGIVPNPEKVKALINVKRPHDLHTVRAFLGLTSYFRRYIPGYAGISAPIERLKLKGAAFVWTDDCEAAFLQLKRRLIEPPILIYPDFTKRFKLYVDSSKLAVGACLMQTVDGRDRVVAYASKLLVGSEKNWIHKQDGTSEIECWGIEIQVLPGPTGVRPVYGPQGLDVVFNENNRTTNAKLARWAMELSQLRFKVFHKAGTLMGHVDVLSRLHTTTIAPITMADLLNDSNSDSDSQVQVRERMLTMTDLLNDSSSNTNGSPQVRESGHAVDGDSCLVPAPDLIEVREHESVDDLADSVPDCVPDERPQPTPGDVRVLDEVVEPQVSSPVDEFGLDMFRFIEEQKRTPWILVLITFLEDRALLIDGQLRVSVLQMAPHYAVKNGILMRRVHLRARAGPARTTLVPVIPLPFIETVLHYCHADLLSSHS
ncbi:LOW QUALITY PROTEIN: Retrovirus-related Pol Polyprotein from transposon 412, partial [Phytophthora megakarya]